MLTLNSFLNRKFERLVQNVTNPGFFYNCENMMTKAVEERIIVHNIACTFQV
jgi:hypothetical protein